MASTLLGIPELIDLALGSPEIGVVNFNILHALLHIMVKEVFCSDSKVELVQSSDGKFETVLHRCLRPSTELCGIAKQHRISNNDIINTREIDGYSSAISMLPTCNSSNNDISPSRSRAGIEPTRYQAEKGIKINCDGKFLRQKINDFLEKKKEAKIANEKSETDNKTEIIVINTNTDFNMIRAKQAESDCNYCTGFPIELKLPIPTTVVANISEVIPLIGCDQTLNQNVSSTRYVQTTTESDGSERSSADNSKNKTNVGEKKDQNIESKDLPSSGRCRDRARGGAGTDSSSSLETGLLKANLEADNRQKSVLHIGANREIESDEITVLEESFIHDPSSLIENKRRFEKIEIDMKNLQHLLQEQNQLITEKFSQIESQQRELNAATILAELNKPSGTTEMKTDDLSFLMSEIRNLQQESCQLKKDIKELVQKIHLNVRIQDEIDEKLHFPIPTSKSQLEYFKERFTKIEESFSDMKNNMNNLEKDICLISQRHGENLTTTTNYDAHNMSALNLIDLHHELTSIKEYIETVMTEIKQVNDDNQEAQQVMENIKASIELLTRTKLDKEEIDELLSEKADYRMLQRKVSVDSFDTNRRKLEKTLFDALKRINEQEYQMKSTMKAVVDNVDKKLDEDALKPIQENLDRKIQTLNDKISSTNTYKKEPEGSATRSIFLRNVNCIACDQHVMMRTAETEILPKFESAVLTKSLKPTLQYNLDNLRKEIKQISTTRNLNHFEILNRLGERLEKEDAKQSANRFCGGSHTKITMQRRLESGVSSHPYASNRPKSAAKCVTKPTY